MRRRSPRWRRRWPRAPGGSCSTTWTRPSCARAVELAAGRAELEASGGVDARERAGGRRDRRGLHQRRRAHPLGSRARREPDARTALLDSRQSRTALGRGFISTPREVRNMPSQTLPAAGTPLTLENIPALKSEVRALAEERNAVILAHNYQVPEVQDVARLRGRLARPLAQGGRHRRRRDRLLRRALHGRDGLDPLAGQDGAAARPRRRLLARRLDHGRPAARLEGRAPGRAGGDVREHHRRGEGRDRLLLHLVERGAGGGAHLARARRRHRDPVRPGHVAGRLRGARDRPPHAGLGRRVPRARRASGPATSRTCATSTPAPSS